MSLLCALFVLGFAGQGDANSDEKKKNDPCIEPVHESGRVVFQNVPLEQLALGSVIGEHAVIRWRAQREVIRVGDELSQTRWLVCAFASDHVLLADGEVFLVVFNKPDGDTRFKKIIRITEIPDWFSEFRREIQEHPESQIIRKEAKTPQRE